MVTRSRYCTREANSISGRPRIIKINIWVVAPLDGGQPVWQLILDLLLERGEWLRSDQVSLGHEGIKLLKTDGIGIDSCRIGADCLTDKPVSKKPIDRDDSFSRRERVSVEKKVIQVKVKVCTMAPDRHRAKPADVIILLKSARRAAFSSRSC